MAATMHSRRRRLPAIALVVPALAQAGMQPLDDAGLGAVAAQDGLRVSLSAPSVSASALTLESDTGVTGQAGRLQAASMTLFPSSGPALNGYWTLDTGADAATTPPSLSLNAHLDRFRLGGSYSGTPTAGNTGFAARLPAEPTRAFGYWTLVSDLDFRLAGQPFYGSPSTTALNLSLSNAVLLYQQNWWYHANLAFDGLYFSWDMPAGTINATDDGLRIAGDTTFRIGFDLRYKFDPDQDMTTVTANDRPLFRFDWNGQITGAEVIARSGGLWDTALNAGTTATFASLPSGRSEGINTGLRWNYGSDFTWRIGHAGGDREYLEFGDWRNLEHNAGPVPGRYGFDFPLIVLDSLDAGSDTNAGGGLCWGGAQTTGSACTAGGQLLKLRAGTVEGYPAETNRSGGAAFVHLIRNGNLLAWSNSVKVGSTGKPALDATYTWGLIYTLANINANFYFHPGGSESDAPGSRSQGVVGDLLFMTQSETNEGSGNWQAATTATPTRWSHGSHFMIADTTRQQGIGLLGARFLLASDDLRLWLKNTWGGQASPANLDGGIDLFSPRTRAQMRGLFGGARIPGGLDLVKIANADFNFEGLWNFRLSPPPTGTSDLLAYSAAIRFRCAAVPASGSTAPFGCQGNAFANPTGSVIASGNGSYISLGEPGRTDVDLRFGSMSGDVAWASGQLRLRASDETGNGKSDLRLSNDILVGASAAARMGDAASGAGLGAGGVAGRPLTTVITFGGNEAWSMAIPAATMHAAITIRPQ